ncbi:hypothetical protein ARMSODRAFT_1027285 [Armillaria solidipes]|uniref:Retrotransposon gag domain-containing protein n=1 Tax=Armillaria solidipes TaxID=1076256 RepID=A0A2H3AS75_9AGAR|nr:hypothetical protein ARMSODRAFT_1027285 [Armillaria solidipes]
MLQPPKPFKRHHDNIERFLGDCIIYFEAFASYFQLSSQMVPFAASLFKDAAKDWWIYPTWMEFVNMLTSQFRDPAIKEVQEKKMFDLQMGNSTATAYFQKLEKEAKLTGRHHDERE